MADKKKIDISMGVDALLENGFFYLEKRKWKQSKEYFEKVIEINPRNSQAYIGLLLVSHKLPTIDSLPNSSKPFDNNNNFKSALRYGNEELISQLHTYVDLYNKKTEEQYQVLCEKLSESKTLENYKECYDAFLKLGKFKNAEAMAEKAKESIDILEYEDCVAKINDNLSEEEYLYLSYTLSEIKYKDSQQLADKCKANYESLKAAREETERKEQIYSSACSSYNKAKSIKDILNVKATFESIADYKDSKSWISKCQSELDSKKLSFLVYKMCNNNALFTSIACILVVVFGIVFSHSLMTYAITMMICLGGGIFVSWMTDNRKYSYLGKSLLVATVIGLLLFLAVNALMSPGGNSNKTEPCGICGGDGVVTQKFLGDGSGVQNGFDTYYRCKGCHGTGIK